MSFINVIWCSSTHLNIKQHPYKARIDVAPLVTASDSRGWGVGRIEKVWTKLKMSPSAPNSTKPRPRPLDLTLPLAGRRHWRHPATRSRASSPVIFEPSPTQWHHKTPFYLRLWHIYEGLRYAMAEGLCGWPNFKHRRSCTYRYSFRSHALLLLFTRESGKRGTTREYVATLKSLGNLEISLYLYWNFIVCFSLHCIGAVLICK